MKRILVIDDDEDLQKVTRIALEKNGFDVISAYTPEEGINKVQSEIPDLVILDVIMPRDFEGFEVAKKYCFEQTFWRQGGQSPPC